MKTSASSSMLPPQRQDESHDSVVVSGLSSYNDVQKKVDLLLLPTTRKTQKQKQRKKKKRFAGVPSVLVTAAFLIVGLEIYTSVTITSSTTTAQSSHKEEQSFLPTNHYQHFHFQEKQQQQQQRNVSTVDSNNITSTANNAGSSSSSSSSSSAFKINSTTSTYKKNNNLQPSIQTCTFHNQTYQVPWNIPTFIIGGAQKTATTSLHRYLSYYNQSHDHPQILSSVNEEPHFFDWKITLPFWFNKSFKVSDDDYNNNNNDNIIFDNSDWDTTATTKKPLLSENDIDDDDERWCYLRYLYSKEFHINKIIKHQLYSFEKTPSYIYNNQFIKRQQSVVNSIIRSSKESRPYLYPNVAKHLKMVCPWLPKVVFVLRNPVDRAYSNYQMLKLQHQRKQQQQKLLNLTMTSSSSSSKKVLSLTFGDCIRNEIKLLRQLNMTTAPILFPTTKKKKQAILFPTTKKKKQANNNNNNNNNAEKMRRLPSYDHPIDEQYWIPSQPYDKIKFDSLGLLQKGMYALQLQYWFHDYPSDKILIINYDELLQQQANNNNNNNSGSQQVYMKILNFVGIGIGIAPQEGSNSSNVKNFGRAVVVDESVFLKRHRVSSSSSTSSSMHKQAPIQQMKDTTRRYLEAFYEPYNDQLANLLGPSWKDVWKKKGI